MKETKKQHAFDIDRDERNKRRRALRRVQKRHYVSMDDDRTLEKKRDYETCANTPKGGRSLQS